MDLKNMDREKLKEKKQELKEELDRLDGRTMAETQKMERIGAKIDKIDKKLGDHPDS